MGTILIDNIVYTLDKATHTAIVEKNVEAGYCGDVVIPEYVYYQGETYRVTAVGFEAFLDCSRLTSMVIPYSVTELYDRAFEGCTGLTSVRIPHSIRHIGWNTFAR